MVNYITIAPNNFFWEQTIKKSRFILNIARITSEEEARLFIDQISKAHSKANHNVFAYTLGDNDQIKRYSDNGEPSGTAGIPMLEVLQKNDLHDVVAVVTRYFGGIKLGAGGLIRAYAGTVADGVKAAGLVSRLTRLKITITIDYKNSDLIAYWLTKHDYQIIDTQYDTAVHIIVPVSSNAIPKFQVALTDLLAGQATFDIGEKTFFEIPVK
ncbi:YigZ family protein [uncultured Leuconostoc sp.]|uniref:YigZ family protein n=1 Tax=uncultured Leuconostoc sp. TaxID=173262 RepID=UPI0025FA259B|nr:YigZ family protein [uncultured Leuconostoc sp.]